MGRVVIGSLVLLDMHAYLKMRPNLLLSNCEKTLRSLERVRSGGCVSVGTVLRRWSAEEAIHFNDRRRPSSSALRVVTYVEVSWPEGLSPKCPIDVLVPI